MPRLQFLHVYGVGTLALALNLLRDAYLRAIDVCELFPQFDFWVTWQEELLLHHTRLPGLQVPISTVLLLAVLVAVFVVAYCNVVELLVLGTVELLSGRWLYNLLFVHLPNWLPFLASDPGVPELLSDGDSVELEEDNDHGNGHDDDALQTPPLKHSNASSAERSTSTSAPLTRAAAARDRQARRDARTARAMEKLLQVKRLHADQTIERPDDWLVFDPQKAALVPKKTLDAARLDRRRRSSRHSSSSSHRNSKERPEGDDSSDGPDER
ncbi:hypothetical protein PINS_up011447 [Pythium insidiosum]|nr:hypothetical protein PINS_up011447 [Pythium insidiosum]